MMIVGLALVPPVVLVWNDRRCQDDAPPLPRYRPLLGRVIWATTVLVVIAGFAVVASIEVWAASQQHACEAHGGTDWSPMDGCE